MGHGHSQLALGVEAALRHESGLFHGDEVRCLHALLGALVGFHVYFNLRLGVELVGAVGCVGYHVDSLGLVFPVHGSGVGGAPLGAGLGHLLMVAENLIVGADDEAE